MKKILGLDLGTNSIGWALISTDENNNPHKIISIGSRIIPMSQDILGKFDSGNSVSQTAERTGYRGVRRLRERQLLRRERLHRVLHIMGYLPKHYEQYIDFKKRLGKFLNETEPKLVWKETESGKFEFIFKKSFLEMVEEFKIHQPQLFDNNNLIPYDWTIYYLRKKALQYKIEKEELAWLLLNFNQKRGYYQLRGEEVEEENPNKLVEFHALKVIDVTSDEPQKGKSELWYNVVLENGWIYRRSSKNSLEDWIGKTKEFIVTTDLNDDGTVKTDKEGKEKRSFRAPLEDDWTLLKKKTETDLNNSNKTVGAYIYNALLQDPKQKINGKLIRTIERFYYKAEIKAILEKQKEFHPELQDKVLFSDVLEELYPNNEVHRNILQSADFTKLFVDDIIFYQRPLKSKKSLISNCKFEYRTYKDVDGVIQKEPIKCAPKSHPLYQELRLWKFVKDLKIYEREKVIDGKLYSDYNVTGEFIKSEDELVILFDWLNERKEITQDTLLSSFFKVKKKKGDEKLPYRWNYVEDKEYPCNEIHSQFVNRLSKIKDIPAGFLTLEKELALWHILYSVTDKHEIEKALQTFVRKNGLPFGFVDAFKKFPPFKNDYGAYSEKALKKLLPLMRMGKYWNYGDIATQTQERISKLITGEVDSSIKNQVREKAIDLSDPNHFRGLPEWLAAYVVYNRHSESSEFIKWKSYHDLERYLEDFKQHSLRNPIVEQVITETLRVVRDIWKKYGDILEIHVELGREMKNPADKRAEMTKRVSENENTNLRMKLLLIELANDNDVENVRPYSPSQQEILKIYEDGVLKSGIEIPEDIGKIAKLSQPSKSELIRYKLWLEQKYCSPYTGEMIPLGKLFTTAYQIEHIIPQSKYFDDSLSNKVICESVVNGNPYKDNQLGYEFISKNEGRIVPELSTSFKAVKIFTLQQYEVFIKQHYANNPGKKKKLLMDDIPEAFIERQMNDTRYISKVVKGLLSNIVREENEEEPTSKNVIPTNGSITDTLKRDWGLNDVWNRLVTPRFERMNELTKSNLFGEWVNKDGKKVFQTQMPLELQKGFNKKRIDHRHHAMDALVIACATRSHVNYLNNESARAKAKESRYDLKNKLCFKAKNGEDGNYKWQFIKPWESFTMDAQKALENIVVSFKQNLRVINKSVNYFQHFVNGEKVIDKQIKGDSWAIRKPLHKDTVAGQVNLRFRKQVSLLAAIEQWEMLVDKSLKTKIKQLINEGLDKKKILKFFAENENKWLGKDISKPEMYYFSNEKEILVASRTALNDSFNSKTIDSITDTGIQKILKNHLAKYHEVKEGKTIEHPELAFSPEGIEDMNKNIRELNGGKPHQPILKVRTYEPKGNKFPVGTTGNKKEKFVEAAKGTNLFFAVYKDEQGKRNYETIPFNIVVERQKQGLSPVPDINDKGNSLLFYLSPNDLVYVPYLEELLNPQSFNFENLTSKQVNMIYKFVDSSDTTANFIQANVASLIFNLPKKDAEKIKESIDSNTKVLVQNEFGVGSPQSKNQKTNDGKSMIKEVCWKLEVDRLGKLRNILGRI